MQSFYSLLFHSLFLGAALPILSQANAQEQSAHHSEESLRTRPFPLQFSIPEEKIVREIPAKDRDFAFIVPGQMQTYIYNTESDYYHDYQRSFFAITCKKGGWDCLRHYEILANGCIPYFLDLDSCDPYTMPFLPKELIKEAMQLEGVSYLSIDHTKFDRAKYFEILKKLLAYTREHLQCRAMAKYVLNQVQYAGNGKILFLSQDTGTDYMRCLTLIGLKTLLQDRVIDVPKIEYIYVSYSGNPSQLYGKGITYSKIIQDIPVDRTNIEQRIMAHEFDLIIYGSVHRSLIYHALVLQHYAPGQILYLCGEDCHQCEYLKLPNLFLREFSGNIGP